MRQGSVPRTANGNCGVDAGAPCVDVGVTLPAGTIIGRAGNAGVTYEPHVHVTIYFWDRTRSWSVPSEFANVFSSSAPSGGALSQWLVPATGSYLSSAAF